MEFQNKTLLQYLNRFPTKRLVWTHAVPTWSSCRIAGIWSRLPPTKSMWSRIRWCSCRQPTAPSVPSTCGVLAWARTPAAETTGSRSWTGCTMICMWPESQSMALYFWCLGSGTRCWSTRLAKKQWARHSF